jgi:hypothetical protein
MEEIYRILYPGQEPPAVGVSGTDPCTLSDESIEPFANKSEANGDAAVSEHPMPLPRDFFEYIIGTSSGG